MGRAGPPCRDNPLFHVGLVNFRTVQPATSLMGCKPSVKQRSVDAPNRAARSTFFVARDARDGTSEGFSVMGSLSIWHWMIVLLIVALVFGTKKLRNIGGDLGSAVKGFKEGMAESEMPEGQRELPRTGAIDAEAKDVARSSDYR